MFSDCTEGVTLWLLFMYGLSLYGHLMPGDIHRKELKKELKLFEFLFEFGK